MPSFDPELWQGSHVYRDPTGVEISFEETRPVDWQERQDGYGLVVTVVIPNADNAIYERVQAALTAAGIDTFETHLQTPEQHAEFPPWRTR